MSQDQQVLRPAQTIGELDVHISYMRLELAKLVTALADMATKQDIHDLEERMKGFATKAELDAVEKKLSAETLQSTFDRWTSLITKLGAAVTVLVAGVGGIVALVHFWDRLPK